MTPLGQKWPNTETVARIETLYRHEWPGSADIASLSPISAIEFVAPVTEHHTVFFCCRRLEAVIAHVVFSLMW
jgi:hypothetical protein